MKTLFAVLAAACAALAAYQVYIEVYMGTSAGIIGKEVSPGRMENIRPVFIQDKD